MVDMPITNLNQTENVNINIDSLTTWHKMTQNGKKKKAIKINQFIYPKKLMIECKTSPTSALIRH